ncbi:uncharacterized protein C9orf153 homolog [Dasypus novemcinctus]|uniref:uncharacterized protein C9orf153 homolog n=1 Tax=Dasypus novemcinctus TaxID=9361 RepID=UPI00265FB57F|nr:uncharacterized protein C9orf153 homolog [Dasypus novemcinctus]
MEARIPSGSLPEFYALVEKFNKESKKSNIKKTHDISLSDAQRILSQNLEAMSPISESDVRKEESQPVFTCTVVKKEEREKPKSMTELLHCSLLRPAGTVCKSQDKLSQHGIPLPKHIFPSDILLDPHPVSSSLTALWKKMQASTTLCRLVVNKATPEQFVFKDKLPQYLLLDPEKQFMDLKDLEWRFYKGIVMWSRRTSDSFITIKYDSEKRFVESQDMPDVIFPPLVSRSLVIYSQTDYQKN